MSQRCKTWISANDSVSFQASGSQGEHLNQKLYYCKSLGSLEKLLTLNLWELFCLWKDPSLCFPFLFWQYTSHLTSVMPHVTHRLTLSMSPLSVLSHFVSSQQAGCRFSKYRKLLLWWQYQATGQYSSSSFPSQIVMPGKSYLAWESHRRNLIIKGLRSVPECEPQVTWFGTQSTSEIHIHEFFNLWRWSKYDVPEQKCATSSVFHEGPIQLVHRENYQLFSLTFQLSLRSWGCAGDLSWLPHLHLSKWRAG